MCMRHVTSKFHHLSASSAGAARLAQSVEHQTFNLRVMGSSPISGDFIYTIFFLSRSCSLFLRCIPRKTNWNSLCDLVGC